MLWVGERGVGRVWRDRKGIIMGEDESRACTAYIDTGDGWQEIGQCIESVNFTMEHEADSMLFTDSCTITIPVTFRPFQLFPKELYKLLHLCLHAKKRRTRKKAFKRLIKSGYITVSVA